MVFKLVSISVPEYTVSSKPDYLAIGQKVDREIETHFSDGSYLIRAIGKDDHPNLSIDQLVEIITKTGIDKYDSSRKPVAYEDFANYDYDIQAGKFEIREGKIVYDDPEELPSLFGETVYNFYEQTPLDRGYAVRIDLLLLYDPIHLELAKKVNPELPGVDPKLEKYLFKFRDQSNKKAALIGVVKITRE